MAFYDAFKEKAFEIEAKLGHRFGDVQLLHDAFTHKSYLFESVGSISHSNERLEFLGDAVLDLIVTDFLFRKYPEKKEGELSQIRARLVEQRALVRYEEKLGLSKYLQLGRGEENSNRNKEALYANLFEAVLGAIYVDGGLEAARKFLFDLFESDMLEMIEQPHTDWKSELQKYSQREYKRTPDYETILEEGPDHNREFRVIVKINGESVGSGSGKSKKEAEQEAAKEAFLKLKEHLDGSENKA